jgi:hypothetical protein
VIRSTPRRSRGKRSLSNQRSIGCRDRQRVQMLHMRVCKVDRFGIGGWR